MNKGRLNGLDLFSGIAGNTLALRDWVRTIAYCEADPHAQAVLLDRMRDGAIERAPICEDIRNISGSSLRGLVDIIVGGFPCQDISTAGKGAGLEGERSGLFFEIVRLAKEIEPRFLFLENVPAIRTRGLDRVIGELSQSGYDCRWTMLSAAAVGAHHKRERWFLLAYAKSERVGGGLSNLSCANAAENGSEIEYENAANKPCCSSERAPVLAYANGKPYESQSGSMEAFLGQSPECTGRLGDSCEDVADSTRERWGEGRAESEFHGGRDDASGGSSEMAHAYGSRLEIGKQGDERKLSPFVGGGRWEPEPDVDRVVNGLPLRVDRIKRLGNAVVPKQAREAFKILMGIA